MTTLFDDTNVRTTDPATSKVAARLDRGSHRERVRLALVANPHGLTDWELTSAVGVEPHHKPSIGKRRQECGAVDTGLRRRGPHGQPCVVWALPKNGATDAA